jgi:hypothetical protein
MLIWRIGPWFWYKKAVMSKKKVIAARNLKKIGPSLPLKTRKAKKKIRVLMMCFPEVSESLMYENMHT